MANAERGAPGTPGFFLRDAPDGQIDLAASFGKMPASDDAAALIIGTEIWPGLLHYIPNGSRGLWRVWDGRCHSADTSNYVHRLVLLFARTVKDAIEACHKQVRAEVSAANPGVTGADLDVLVAAAWKPWGDYPAAKYARGLRGRTGSANLREMLASHRGTSGEAFLDHHWRLLNAGNCVINLLPAEGEADWLEHDPALMMTYCVDASYYPPDRDEHGAELPPADRCPQFASLLWRATGQNPDVYWYLIKLLGYSLLGRNPHHLVFFLSGPTASGKSALLEIVSTVLGARLAYDARPALISTSPDRHSRDEVSMTGRRLITIAETNDRLYIDEMQLKRLTGQGTATISPLFATETSSIPVTWAIIVANNDMPSVSHLDGALNRRIWVVPMGPTIPPEERNADKVAEVVEQESDGVLALLVWGCRAAMAVGADGRPAILSPPLDVEAKTEEWKITQDTVALWMAEKMIFSPNGSTPAVEGRHCWRDYVAWCRSQDPKVPPLGRNNFYESLSQQPGMTRTGDNSHNWFRGFLLRETPVD